MILLISTCAHKLSELEFVKPVSDLIPDSVIKHYSEVNEEIIDKADKIIICGTAIKDFDYLNHDWSWLKSFNKPVMGLCAGYQVIAKVMGESLFEKELIGVKVVNDFKSFFVITKLATTNNFTVKGVVEDLPVIIEHHSKPFIGYAFHPEVMNQDLIKKFI